jgi:hypothetical protein
VLPGIHCSSHLKEHIKEITGLPYMMDYHISSDLIIPRFKKD